MNHALHGGPDDLPKKKKAFAKKISENSDKFVSAAEFGVALKQIDLTELRVAMKDADKIGSFSKFASKYSKLKLAGKVLGKVSAGATIFTTGTDIYDYNNGNIRRFSFLQIR